MTNEQQFEGDKINSRFIGVEELLECGYQRYLKQWLENKMFEIKVLEGYEQEWATEVKWKAR